MSAILLTIAIFLLVSKAHRLRGYTLQGSFFWLVFAFAVNAIVELSVTPAAAPSQGWRTALQFAAATALICPHVSVLGAKRPQHRAWHAIVFSLWLILILPAAEGYFVRRSAALEVHDARGWFLWILILVGWFNYLPTRYGLASTAFAAAQTMLLAAHLPLIRSELPTWARIIAFALILAATLQVTLSPPKKFTDPLTKKWQTFRNAYGAIWSLRIQDRLNQTARTAAWPIQLEWNQITYLAEPTDRQTESFARCLRTALRRFVPNKERC